MVLALCRFGSVALLVLFGTAWSLAFGSASAMDLRATDILKLHLGMAEPDVTGALVAQGIMASRIQRQYHPCPQVPETGCLDWLKARTRDGWLSIGFAPPSRDSPTERVNRITYTLDGRLPGESDIIRNAVVDRFGPPASWKPMTWCQTPEPGGGCPHDQVRMTLIPGTGTSMILSLMAPGTS